MAAAGSGAIDFQVDLAQAISIFAQLSLDCVTVLRPFTVLRLELLHGFGAVLHVLGQRLQLGVEFCAFLINRGKLTRQHHAKLGTHLFAQLGVALGLGGLALQRIHLACHFVENIVHARKVQFGIFEARFGQALLGLELGDSRGLFEDGPSICGAAAENLADSSLLDQSVGFWAEPRAHKEFLNVAQTAEFSVQQILAVAGAEQAARDDDFSCTELLLVEFSAANLKHNLRRGQGGGGDWRYRGQRP